MSKYESKKNRKTPLDIKSDLKKLFSDPILNALKYDKEDVFKHRKTFLLKGTEHLYTLWKIDEQLGYPFFKDVKHSNPKERLAEHEKVGNFIYSINTLYYNAYTHLCVLVFQVIKPLLLEEKITSKSKIDHRFRTLPGDFFINLCSTLDILSLLIAFIQGYPIDVYRANMRKILLYLRVINGENMNTLISQNKIKQSEVNRFSNLSSHTKSQSQPLINRILPISTSPNGLDWVEEIYDYRNYFAHKNFMALVITSKGNIYLPKKPNILPSIILNEPNPTILMSLCNPEPLHKYCIRRFIDTRNLVEITFECLKDTYEWRLEKRNWSKIKNPHESFRKLNQ